MTRTYDKGDQPSGGDTIPGQIRRPTYRRDTIWQRTAQARLTWMRHADAHGTLRLPNDDDDESNYGGLY